MSRKPTSRKLVRKIKGSVKKSMKKSMKNHKSSRRHTKKHMRKHRLRKIMGGYFNEEEIQRRLMAIDIDDTLTKDNIIYSIITEDIDYTNLDLTQKGKGKDDYTKLISTAIKNIKTDAMSEPDKNKVKILMKLFFPYTSNIRNLKMPSIFGKTPQPQPQEQQQQQQEQEQ